MTELPTWQDGSPTLVFDLGKNEIGVCNGELKVCKKFLIGSDSWAPLSSMPISHHDNLKSYLDLGNVKAVFGAGKLSEIIELR